MPAGQGEDTQGRKGQAEVPLLDRPAHSPLQALSPLREPRGGEVLGFTAFGGSSWPAVQCLCHGTIYLPSLASWGGLQPRHASSPWAPNPQEPAPLEAWELPAYPQSPKVEVCLREACALSNPETGGNKSCGRNTGPHTWAGQAAGDDPHQAQRAVSGLCHPPPTHTHWQSEPLC